jgi:hypothetical protein
MRRVICSAKKKKKKERKENKERKKRGNALV